MEKFTGYKYKLGNAISSSAATSNNTTNKEGQINLFNDGGSVEEKNRAVAREILSQLGGMNRLVAMTGAYNFIALPNGVSFRLKNPRANYVKITLTSMDLYDLEVGRIRGTTYKVVDKQEGLYDNMLKPAIEKATGMYLSLAQGGNLPYPKGDDKITKVMHEYSAGKLYTPQGKKVTDYHQAVAIALSEQRASEKMEHGGNINKLRGVTIVYEDGSKSRTSINGTDEDIRKYYIGQKFNVGVYPQEKMMEVVDVIFDDEEKMEDGGYIYAKGGKTKKVKDKERMMAMGIPPTTTSEYKEGTPKIYVADLHAYNSGDLVGEWIDLSEYSSGSDVMAKIQELLSKWSKKAGEVHEEYAIHDFENFPRSMYSESMGERNFDEVIEYNTIINDSGIPEDVVEKYVDYKGGWENAKDTLTDAFSGSYKDKEDWAYELVESLGGPGNVNNPENYISIYDTDRRIMAGEQADFYVDDIDDDRAVEEADMQSEYDAAETDEEKEKIIEQAREQLKENIYNDWYKGLEYPYNFLVEEQGLYDSESLLKAGFVQFDYEKFADDLENDNYVTFDGNDGKLYVFDSSYKRGGTLTKKIQYKPSTIQINKLKSDNKVIERSLNSKFTTPESRIVLLKVKEMNEEKIKALQQAPGKDISAAKAEHFDRKAKRQAKEIADRIAIVEAQNKKAEEQRQAKLKELAILQEAEKRNAEIKKAEEAEAKRIADLKAKAKVRSRILKLKSSE